MDTIERKIHFLRAELPRSPKTKKRPPFDQVPILKTLDAMEFILADHGRYQADEGGYLFASIPKDKTDRVLFGKSRRTSLPPVERNGEFSDLPIPADAGLAEMAHIVFFPNGIVGAEFNVLAPRGSKFGWYLSKKCNIKGLQINPLMSLDATAALDSAEGIRALTIRTTRSEADIIEEYSQAFGRAIKGAAELVPDAQDFAVVIKPASYSGERLSRQSVKDVVTSLLKINHERGRKVVKELTVETSTPMGGNRVYDLLGDRLVVSQQVVALAGKSRRIDDASAFAAVESAYDQVKDVVEKCRTIYDE